MRISDMSEQEKKPNFWVFSFDAMDQFIDVLKASCIYESLLSQFEKELMYDLRTRYSKFTFEIAVSHKQMIIVTNIAAKLNVPYNLLMNSL